MVKQTNDTLNVIKNSEDEIAKEIKSFAVELSYWLDTWGCEEQLAGVLYCNYILNKGDDEDLIFDMHDEWRSGQLDVFREVMELCIKDPDYIDEIRSDFNHDWD